MGGGGKGVEVVPQFSSATVGGSSSTKVRGCSSTIEGWWG